MKRYLVSFTVDALVTIEVEAENEEDAVSIAERDVNSDDAELGGLMDMVECIELEGP